MRNLLLLIVAVGAWSVGSAWSPVAAAVHPPGPKPPGAEQPPAPDPTPGRMEAEPSAEAQKKAERDIKDALKVEYAKPSPVDRLALARTLINGAAGSADEPATRYVMLREARDLGAGCGDLATVVESVDCLRASFKIDAPVMKAQVFSHMVNQKRSKEDNLAFMKACVALIDPLLGEDDGDHAVAMAGAADSAARAVGDAGLMAESSDRLHDTTAKANFCHTMRKSMETLAAHPDDPQACLEVGRYLSFIKGDVKKGLPLLAKCAMPAFKAAATEELKNPGTGLEIAQVADLWFAAAQGESTVAKAGIFAHASQLYEDALPQVSGLVKTHVEQRLEDCATVNGSVDLLKLVDVNKDTLQGNWARSGKFLLTADATAGKGHVTHSGIGNQIQFPYVLPLEYDVEMIVRRTKGNGYLLVGLNGGGKAFTVAFDHSQCLGVANVDGREPYPTDPRTIAFDLKYHHAVNETGVRFTTFANAEKSSVLQIAVRKNRVVIGVNGTTIQDWPADFKRVSLPSYWTNPTDSVPFIAAFPDSTFEISRATIKTVSGTGKRLR